MPSLELIQNNLGKAQRGLLRAADAIPAEQWSTRPEEGKWSAGEVVAHLVIIERAIIAAADKMLQQPPRHVPFIKRWHVPMALVESRWIRRKTPIPQGGEFVGSKEDLLAELRDVRERTLAFIDETKSRDLRPYRRSHAFLGSLNLYGWLQMIASHETRHIKQMKEIATNLPKVVANSQK